jgi:1-acyl-sn-glycerol-3-phosphate acyltransferase
MTASSAPLPQYEMPRLAIARFVLDALVGRPRSFARDAREVLDANPYARTIVGLEHVATDGPLIVVMNHFNRPGLRPYHCAMVVSAVLAERLAGGPEVRWAFTSEYRDRKIGPVPIPPAVFRWAFSRIARTYDFVALPRQEMLVMNRALALRQLARRLAVGPIGLAPEGLLASDTLVEPPPGTGRFLQLLANGVIPLLPVAAWEEDSALTVRFGEPFHLPPADALSRAERDRLARDEVMIAIGTLMPRRYWGVYDARIAAAGEPLA